MLTTLVVGCVHPPQVVDAVAEVHRAELWVDAFSQPGGDGSAQHPLKKVPAPLAPNTTLHLRSGLYAGPFTFEAGARVEGTGEVVLTGEAGQTTVTALDATLVGLSIQGGDVGLEAGAGLMASKVRFSGQRRRAVRVTGTATVEDLTVVGSVEGIDGVEVERSASLRLTRASFSGGLRRGLSTEGGTLVLSQLKSEGVKTLVHAVDANVELDTASANAGVGPAVFFAAGHAKVRALTVQGHEYGLQLARGANVEVEGLTVSHSAQACVSSVQGTLRLDTATLSQCGLSGAVVLINAETHLTNLTVSKTNEVGVFLRQGSLTLRKSSFSSINGNALELRDAKATLEAVRVSDVEGSALFASAFAQVTVSSLDVERAHQSAVFVERKADVSIESLLVRGGQGRAVVVPDAAHARLRSVSVAGGTELPIYAECRDGAHVEVGRIESTIAPLASQCVTPLLRGGEGWGEEANTAASPRP